MNFRIYGYMKGYIRDNLIESIFLFGSDARYMYRLARKLTKKCNITLTIYTCEDYPLKDFNYIEQGKHNKDTFFKLLLRSLKKQVSKAYQVASSSIFNNESLKDDYMKIYKINNPNVRCLPTTLTKVDYKARDIKHIIYGGNLYDDRINFLIDISKAFSVVAPSVSLHIYGKGDNLDELISYPNVIYQGVVDYSKMIEVYKRADMLLHVDGFSSIPSMTINMPSLPKSVTVIC